MALLYVGFATLNGALAVAVLSVRPRRSANVAASWLFGLNAASSVLQALRAAADLDSLGAAIFTVEAASIVPLAALILYVPRRRLGTRLTWTLLALAAVASLALPLTRWAGVAEPPLALIAYGLVFGPLVPALGAIVFLDSYLGAASHVQRGQARILLAAFVLKSATLASAFRGALLVAEPKGEWGLFVATLAVPIAILSSRLRGAGAERPMAEDGFVLAFLALGLLLPFTSAGVAMEYLIVRPLLFAYAILKYQLLEVDLQERRATFGTALVAGFVTMLLVVQGVLERDLGLPTGPAVGLAVVASLSAGGIVAWPVARALVSPARPATSDPHARDVYLAALEQAVQTTGHDTTEDAVLRALRARLGISDREHALMEATVRASAGSSRSPVEGAVFLGRYRVERTLGEGGFGRTFLARDLEVGRDVVLKIAKAHAARDAERMLREARVLARISSPSLVTVYDVERVASDCILVLEYVPGGSLEDRLRREGALPLADALRIADDVLSALEAAHAQGVVHRDVKPANVLLSADGSRAKLGDFGIAKVEEDSGTVSGFSLDGEHPGSLRAMSPEQVRGMALDGRSDLYAVGALLHRMLSGREYLDFEGRAGFDTRLAILEEPPLLPIEGAPAEVNALLEDALAKERDARPSDAQAFRRRLAPLIPTP